jgi:uncharacterized repeat protein (TIGR03803 family)
VALTIAIATLTLVRGAAAFQLDGEPDRAGAYNILHLFTWANGPTGNLVFDAAGNLYGTTELGGGSGCGGSGCGAAWKLARNPKGTWTVSILHAFTGADGSAPFAAGLIFDAAGNLYGTTSQGGSTACHYGCGVVFKLSATRTGPGERACCTALRAWTETVRLAG